MNNLVHLLLFFFIACQTLIVISQVSSNDGLLLCQHNCADETDRLVGPTKPKTRGYPYIASKLSNIQTNKFCSLGCQYLFANNPTNVSCLQHCTETYRIKTTVGYNDMQEIAKLECYDGCNIGLKVCQAGYFCNQGIMLPCPRGKFRESIVNISLDNIQSTEQCIDCPYGRYRSIEKGKSPEECSLCPRGKYAYQTGGVSEESCIRCPAGQFANEEGSRVCKCITPGSCSMEISSSGEKETFFSDGVDYFRETIPYVGRW